MGAKLGRRFLKQPVEKLKAVFVVVELSGKCNLICRWIQALYLCGD